MFRCTASSCMAWSTVLTVLTLLWTAPATAEVSLTIYSHADPRSFDPQRFIAQQRQGYDPAFAWQVPGFAVVRDRRMISLVQGENLVRFTDVAQFIDPTTVALRDLSGSDQNVVRILEQGFQFDLVSSEKLLERYLDRPIQVDLKLGDGHRETISGVLLSATQGRLVLKTDQGLRIVSASNDIQLQELPEGLITRPTLLWRLVAPQAGQRTIETTYQTNGLTWRADYNLLLSPDEQQADLGAWVTILNLSGAAYPDAELKLIAGDVQRIQPQAPQLRRAMDEMALAAWVAPETFQERAFFEYHLYTLPRRTSIDQNAVQQIALFPTIHGIRIEKKLVYYGQPEARWWTFPSPATDRELGQKSNKKVDVYLRFENRENNKLGIPLPAGKIRVYKADQPDSPQTIGTLEFIGEDLIDHTARNEEVLIKVGQAFDVTGERVQTDFRTDISRRWMQESFRIILRNAKKELQNVTVRETLYRWVNWKITRNTEPYKKIDARTVHFDIQVPPDGEKTLEYTVEYTW